MNRLATVGGEGGIVGLGGEAHDTGRVVYPDRQRPIQCLATGLQSLRFVLALDLKDVEQRQAVVRCLRARVGEAGLKHLVPERPALEYVGVELGRVGAATRDNAELGGQSRQAAGEAHPS